MKKTIMLALLPMLWLFTSCPNADAPATDEPAPEELRGIWLTNVDSRVLDSRESIRAAMQFLADHHFNAVFPVVWNDAVTLFPSQVMDSLFGLPIDPRYAGRDPLQEVIEEAHQRGIAVIPWFEYGFAASYQKNGGDILKAKPHWAAADSRGGLLTKNGFEWMNGYHAEVQQFLLSLVKEVASHYDVDGVQGDDRLPAQPIEGGYSAHTDSLFRAEHNGAAPPDDFRDPAWQRWRADRLSQFAHRLYAEVNALKSNLIISWAPSIYPWCYDEYLQDWPAWLQNGDADIVIPQCYRYNLADYKSTVNTLIPAELATQPGDKIIFPGILMNVGDYTISEELLMQKLAYNREKGYCGEVFFFYEGLRKNDDALSKKLLESYYHQKATLPF
ncbi:MAG: glycoside hydrolase family 10 protein [Candidatus Zhuqueibacterota bacterium]